MRMFDPASGYCRMTEFFALIAGMALMLAHITSCFGDNWDQLLAHQRLGDRAIVERALECIDLMSEQQGNVLAVRCAALLAELVTIEEETARQHSPTADQSNKPDDVQRDILIMLVPYLGSIKKSRRGVTVIPTDRSEEEPSPLEDVTIGVIGSVSLGQPRKPVAGREYGGRNGVNAAVRIRSLPPISDQGQLPPVTYNAPTDLPFPEVLTDFDDGLFQGVDTAFIETPMRGSADAQGDLGFGDDRWDLGPFR